MIYRMTILAESGMYEGWAHSIEEMERRFQSEKDEHGYVFLFGDEPKALTYRQYGECVGCGMDALVIRFLDKKLLAVIDE